MTAPMFTIPGAGMGAREVARAAGVSYRVLDYWCRTGVLVPDVNAATGSGSKRRYSPEQVRIARVLAQLARHGARGDVLKAVADQLADLDDWLWAGRVFVDDLGRVSRIGGGVAGWTVDLARIADAA